VEARLQRRVQRYGWDLAAADHEALWPAQLAPAQAALQARGAPVAGERVLDVACGTGLVSFDAARAVGPHGRVVGVALPRSDRALARRPQRLDSRRVRRCDGRRVAGAPGENPAAAPCMCARTETTTVGPQDIDLTAWIGRVETVHDTLGPTPLVALAATLDHPAAPVAPGAALPLLWHWLYFLPVHRQSELGPDGHARRGGFLPPVPLPRRMWAGSQFEFRAPLRVGDAVERRSTIADVTGKTDHTGRLVFVRVRHELRCHGAAEPALVELHDIVYRAARQPGDVGPAPRGSARSSPTRSCCSATRRSPSTATASTTTAATSPRSRATRAWSCTAR
jgi:SAM-dependent methyltransferase